jgi:anti-sigma factor RsiW
MSLDGELPAEERADFEAWLDADPEMKTKEARFAEDTVRLQEALAGVLDEPVPERLTRPVAAGRVRQVLTWRRWRAAAAAAVVFIAGGVAGYFVGAGGPRAEERLAEQAIGAYMTYAVDQPRAVEVEADDRYYLNGWLSKRVGLKLVAPDLSAEGFELLGGRVLPSDDRAAALLVYRNKAGEQVSIYVTAEAGDKIWGTYTAEPGGPRATYWLDKGFGCAVVSALPEERMTDVAKSAWRQLLQGAAT